MLEAKHRDSTYLFKQEEESVDSKSDLFQSKGDKSASSADHSSEKRPKTYHLTTNEQRRKLIDAIAFNGQSVLKVHLKFSLKIGRQ